MELVEINFDGLIGPSHNYSGLSFGNLAATAHAGQVSHPRAAALQGLEKMRHNMALGLPQGVLLPLPRPNNAYLGALNADKDTDPAITAMAWSASSMWTANAATVSPAPDTADGRCHLTPANLVSMPHRAHEWPDTFRQLQIAFASTAHFALHPPVPSSFGDEGAANHMRMCTGHGSPGLEIFVYGRPGGRFPARQHEQASRAIARGHLLDPARTLFIEQNPDAIAAGAFHNDVVAVANETVLFCHELAFAEPEATYAAIRKSLPEAEIIVVPASEVSLADAVSSYLFNAQLVSLPEGGMGLVVPQECTEQAATSAYLACLIASNGPVRRVLPVDVRQSMSNGGGPACLRLRVVADPATIDPRFLIDEARADRIEQVIRADWPEMIAPDDLRSEALEAQVVAARQRLLAALDLEQLG
ncbi:N-succinylarginine dihydrolase [Novosphingobium sp. TH158]|uniref:N-succinylarginine dihydrolase n=1 Tax=Novosphingobium sp. TH158 TaxID=2067455 RepID=UPI000C7A8032|nr:N-succinylarginine dihydrolase [Novosphingobium sp. TH158]PLK26087.1 succinylarginine dihydrolase [Novosphingobium sp. TH158]